MHKPLSLILAGVVSLAAVGLAVSARGDDAGLHREVLGRIVGTWRAEAVVFPSKTAEREIRRTGTVKSEWFLHRQFVRSAGNPEATDSNPVLNFEGSAFNIWGYDSGRKVYRHWYFDSAGNSADYDGAYDEKTQTLTFRGQLQDGATVVNTAEFIDQDNQKWTSLVHDKDGNLLLHIEMTLKRKE